MTELHIYTYQNGQIKNICNTTDVAQQDVAGGIKTFLFQIEGEKTLYGFKQTIDERKINTYYQLT